MWRVQGAMSLALDICHLLLLVYGAGAQSIPVYGRYQICVVADTCSQYRNPFNYTEVFTQGVFSGPDGKVTVDG
jgi:hypothetical protein